MRRRSSSTCRPCRGLGQFGGFDHVSAGSCRRGPRRARAGAEAPARQGRRRCRTLRRRASERAAGHAAAEARPSIACRRSRWGCRVAMSIRPMQLMLAPVYVNDFFYQRPHPARHHAGRCAVSQRPDALQHFYVPSTNDASATPAGTHAADDAAVERRAAAAGSSARRAWCATTATRRSRSTARPRPATARARRWRDAKIIEQDVAARFRLRLGRPVAAGNHLGQPGADAVALSILVVFLCLAALYESWTIPVAVLLVVPLGVLGAVALLLRRRARSAERRLFQDRPDHDHRSRRQERDPDRRVRGRGAAPGQAAARGRHRRRRGCACARS